MATVRSRNYVTDSLGQLKAAGLVAASAAGSLILDVGDAFMDGLVVIDVTALEIASNDETYTIVLQGSNTASFGTATDIAELCAITIGDKVPKVTDADFDDVVGRYFLPFVNERAGTLYRYLRLYTVVAGSVATGINYAAHVAKIR